MKPTKTAVHRQGGAPAARTGQYPGRAVASVEADSASRLRTKAEPERTDLMEVVVERGNLWKAYERVHRNKGAAGVDGIDRAGFKAHLQRHWPTIKAKLLAGEYIPSRFAEWISPSRRAE